MNTKNIKYFIKSKIFDMEEQCEMIDIGKNCIYDWQIYSNESNTFLYAWCMNDKNESVLLRIENFKIVIYVEISDQIDLLTRNDLIEHLDNAFRRIKDDRCFTAKIKFVKRQKLYYFNDGKLFPMLRIELDSINNMYECERYFKSINQSKIFPDKFRPDNFKFKVYETKVSLVRKLLTERNLKYSGWVTGKGYLATEDNKISSVKNEYIIPYENLYPLNDESKSSYPYIMSVDIECYSSCLNRMPNEKEPTDKIFAISCICGRLGSTERKRYIIAIGKDLKCQIAHVIECEDENMVLREFKNLIVKENPEVIIGYNILGFDFKYLDARMNFEAVDSGVKQEFRWGRISKLDGYEVKIEKKSWESSAFSFNEFYLFDNPGRISLDLFPIIKRDYKLTKYDLDTVSNQFLGKGKHPVKAKDIFQLSEKYFNMFDNNEEDEITRKEYIKVLDYCVQDSELVFELLDKLSIWIGMVELSNIVGVSIMDLFTRGQQIRCLSQIYDLTTRNNIVLDNRELDEKEEIPFAGGYVQEPIPGLYDNIICLDFASLYPSIIQAYNICYTTLLKSNQKILDEDSYHEIKIEINSDEIDDGNDEDKSPEDKDEKQKTFIIKQNHKFVKKEKFYGILPRLVAKLVDERKAVRKQLEGVKDPVLKTILDKRQLALKISANSVFGFLGVAKGKLPLMEGAMSITSKGRELIQHVNEYVSHKYNAKIVYNDSVSGNTPILIRDKTGSERWIRIQELFKLENKQELFIDAKERFLLDRVEIWSDMGWTEIKQAIRHKTNKQMYRVLTHSGCVDVTEDHSLFLPDNTKISPKDCSIGTKLLHKDLPDVTILYKNISEFQAMVWGFFYSEGSCGKYICKSEVKNYWAISCKEYNLLEKYKNYLEIVHSEYGWKILDTLEESSKVYKLFPLGNINELVAEYSSRFYDNKHKIVPFEILHSDKETITHFLNGYQEGNGLERKGIKFANKGEIGSAGLFHLYKIIGKCISVNSNLYNKDCFWFCPGDKIFRDTDTIKKILPLGECEDYVYDIETGNHHFAAGIGRLIVSNTDSSMIDLNITDTKLCNEWGHKLSEEISKLFPPPIKMEFEKAMRMLCIKKKKYAAFLVDKHGNLNTDPKKMLVRGIVLARRDSSKWVQNVYSKLLYNVMTRNDMFSSLNIIYNSVEELVENKLDINNIVTVRSLKSNYKNPNYFMNVFANKLKRLGYNVNAGERLEYLIIKSDEHLLGERMITPELYREGGYKIDVLYYLDHLLKNPIDQLFSIGHMKELEDWKDVGCKKPRSKKKFSISKPVELTHCLLEMGYTLIYIKQNYFIKPSDYFPLNEDLNKIIIIT
jgi:DNA polymerase elongation subunit (family B)